MRVHVELLNNCSIAETLKMAEPNTFERPYNVIAVDMKGILVCIHLHLLLSLSMEKWINIFGLNITGWSNGH